MSITNLKIFNISDKLKKGNFNRPFDCTSKSSKFSIELHYAAMVHSLLGSSFDILLDYTRG